MSDLFTEKMTVVLPTRYALRGRVAGNLIRHVAHFEEAVELPINSTSRGYFTDASAERQIAFIRRGLKLPTDYEQIIRIDEVAPNATLQDVLVHPSVRWLKPAPFEPKDLDLQSFSQRHSEIRTSWQDALSLREERYDGDDNLIAFGFRPPQIGALHAIKAHWVVSDLPGTLVMPTGTGKTETMLGVLVSEDVQKLLVVVPSDQLRTQIADKFVSLGVLRAAGLLANGARHPIVAMLKNAPKTGNDVDALFGRAQVVVATMQALSRLSVELKDRIADHVTHLFVDEAHHIGAATWKSFKTHFVRRKRRILQFTATPYRNDNRRVDGKFIFVYPLRRAREQHLFRPVHYVPVLESDETRADLSIIQKVGETLDRDLVKFEHLAMARTSSIARAEALLALYSCHLPGYRAALVHSKMAASERADVLRQLRSGDVRIVICVDMLGEGFDLPRLKIAALHDRHHSEAVTLQFIGRFTRAEKGLGDATVIAGVSLEDPREWLNALYKEDADWNTLLETGSERRVEHQRRREDLYSGLDQDFENIPAETVTPRLNAYVFRTHCSRWDPQTLEEIESANVTLVEGPIVNDELRLIMTVTRHEDRLRWTRVNQPADVVYNLIMAHWDQEKELLYVHSYPEDGLVLSTARLLCGDDVELLKGEDVFRVLHGFRRVMLTNLGVKETQVKPIRFQLSTGIDITGQLEATVDNRTRVKTNLFGSGFVDVPVYAGDDVDEMQAGKCSIGCSTKGKIWSQDKAVSPDDWIRWCETIGPKIADESINTEMVLRNVLRPKRQQSFPAGKIPVSIDWPEGLSVSDEDRVEIGFGQTNVALSDCDLEISAFQESAPVRFRLRSDGLSADFQMDIRDGVAVFRRTSAGAITIRRGKRMRDLIDLFHEDPPAIRFTDGDMLVGADLASAPGDNVPFFDVALMTPMAWEGVDITKESQGPTRQSGTIQFATIARLMTATQPYDLIFDGDTSGEVADIVAIRRQGRFLDVELYHCKYSTKPETGARVDDLYDVCGQAMKAVRWADPRSKFLQRLRKQEENRNARGGQSRFVVGNRPLLDEWLANRRDMVTRFSMTLVQPGYSKTRANNEHLPLLGAVQSYLQQTYNIGLTFWSSP
ncbi:DEAD/DEAH box helicase [Rhizobium leguminosarum]|uniref:DEAD/DEAH box helicase n=1 Tax=Rhizobium TaxID=379 RepID=UPI00160A4F98|nr:DEAD/DEAH box helicase family protein [Rhizobium leguminosarum]MBB4508076.1 superfamily II DNA or RNA helicase [Rhizobium leguminosarum]